MGVFWVTYRTLKFGTENEYNDQDILMGIATDGGEEDARQACLDHHSGCKIMKIEKTH